MGSNPSTPPKRRKYIRQYIQGARSAKPKYRRFKQAEAVWYSYDGGKSGRYPWGPAVVLTYDLQWCYEVIDPLPDGTTQAKFISHSSFYTVFHGDTARESHYIYSHHMRHLEDEADAERWIDELCEAAIKRLKTEISPTWYDKIKGYIVYIPIRDIAMRGPRVKLTGTSRSMRELKTPLMEVTINPDENPIE